MTKEKLNAMNVLGFILNISAALIAVLLFVRGSLPSRTTNPAQWFAGVLTMPIYGLGMFILLIYVIYIEYKKTVVSGPEFFVHDFKKTYDNETVDNRILEGTIDPSWNINFIYTLVNKGDVKARFKYEILMTLDVNDDDGNPLEANAMQSIEDKRLGPGQDSLDELLTFHFKPKEKAEQWSEATILFIVNYKNHDFEPQSIDFPKTIQRNP